MEPRCTCQCALGHVKMVVRVSPEMLRRRPKKHPIASEGSAVNGTSQSFDRNQARSIAIQSVKPDARVAGSLVLPLRSRRRLGSRQRNTLQIGRRRGDETTPALRAYRIETERWTMGDSSSGSVMGSFESLPIHCNALASSDPWPRPMGAFTVVLSSSALTSLAIVRRLRAHPTRRTGSHHQMSSVPGRTVNVDRRDSCSRRGAAAFPCWTARPDAGAAPVG
jgi:hypothetical protein